MSKISPKTIDSESKKTGESKISPVETARSYLQDYLHEFGTEMIEKSMELESFEIIENEKSEVDYEVTFSYYTKNKTFSSDNANGFQIPNVKNYRKIVLGAKGELLKITFKID